MRVLHVNYEFPGVTENCGGGGRVTALLDEHLPAHGVESRVVTDTADGHWSTFPARCYSDIAAAIREFDPDVLHGHFSMPSSMPLPRLAACHDLPLVISVMGADIYDPSRFTSLRWATDRVNGHLFDHAAAVVAPSEDMVERVEAKHEFRPRLIPYGIRASRWAWRERSLPEAPTVLTVCRQVERKRLQRGINAVARLRESWPQATYRLIGEGPQHEQLRQATTERDWLEVSGYVDDLQAAFDDADVFLLPSDHEAFGIVLLEAVACGLPCVTTETGGQSDIVVDDVGMATAPDDIALASALKYVLSEYEALQANTEGYVNRCYSADRMARQYADLYAEVAQQR